MQKKMGTYTGSAVRTSLLKGLGLLVFAAPLWTGGCGSAHGDTAADKPAATAAAAKDAAPTVELSASAAGTRLAYMEQYVFVALTGEGFDIHD